MNKNNHIHTLFLGGGCFWGVEAFIKKLPGVYTTEVGYANGLSEHPTYEEVCHGNTGHAEVVKVTYDEQKISTKNLLKGFFTIINPTSKNKQGNDRGLQYRTGIYYEDMGLLPIIQEVITDEQANYQEDIVTEVMALQNYEKAEEYHQAYLDKNPNGYCHVNLSKADVFIKKNLILNEDIDTLIKKQSYHVPTKEEIKRKLSSLQYSVTQLGDTERPYTSEYTDQDKKGIYVDIVSGEPLFTSLDKFQAGCGWPSFTKPIASSVIQEKADTSLRMIRTEVKTNTSNIHLGHVFEDGPQDKGGLRYCINGASLNFIPYEEMKEKGYEYLMHIFE